MPGDGRADEEAAKEKWRTSSPQDTENLHLNLLPMAVVPATLRLHSIFSRDHEITFNNYKVQNM